jgi:hypothetical protein
MISMVTLNGGGVPSIHEICEMFIESAEINPEFLEIPETKLRARNCAIYVVTISQIRTA